ncbi:MAG: hypothetical protein KDJ35_08345 [Alphaproteobacteria bacterium]|nr:hypothetical protein [Alphaproteobacteria bacterium]
MRKISDEKLWALGLPLMQSRVYVAALELGQAGLQALSRKSGVNRSTIYTFIDELKARGYLYETRRGKRKLYNAASPVHVMETARARMNTLESLLPELEALNNASMKKPRVRYYEGMQGIKEVYLDMINDAQDIVSYEDLQHLKEGLPKVIYDRIPAERAANNVRLFAISRDTPTARQFCKQDKELKRQTKFITNEEFKTEIKIYGHKIALINLRGLTPFCVLIENQHLADTMRMLWKQLWDRL